jgi:hypothetical protein
LSSIAELLRDLKDNDLGAMYEEFLGELQRRGIPGAVDIKRQNGLYVTPFERGTNTVEEELDKQLEELVRQASQEKNPSTPSLEEFLRQVMDDSPADVEGKHSTQTAHERLVYGEDATKSLLTALVTKNKELAAQRKAEEDKVAFALKVLTLYKQLSEKERPHEHKFDEKGECLHCGHKKAMSAEDAEKREEDGKKQKEEEDKKHEEALARVVNSALAPLVERLTVVEKQMGIPSPVGKSAEAQLSAGNGIPTTDTTLTDAGLQVRTFQPPTAPNGEIGNNDGKAKAISDFMQDAMSLIREVDKQSPIEGSELRRDVVMAKAAWSMSTQPTPPKLDHPELRKLAEKHGLPVFKFGK